MFAELSTGVWCAWNTDVKPETTSLSRSPPEFTLGSFCSIVDVTNFSRLQTLRLDGNEISRQDVPSESSVCLRLASSIEVWAKKNKQKKRPLLRFIACTRARLFCKTHRSHHTVSVVVRLFKGLRFNILDNRERERNIVKSMEWAAK